MDRFLLMVIVRAAAKEIVVLTRLRIIVCENIILWLGFFMLRLVKEIIVLGGALIELLRRKKIIFLSRLLDW